MSTSVWMGVADLADGVVQVDGVLGPWTGGEDIPRILLRRDGQPLGWTDKSPAEITTVDFDDLRSPTLPGPDGADGSDPVKTTDITVIICTRNRSKQLARGLERLLVALPAETGLIIVDNAPSDDLTQQVVQSFQGRFSEMKYIREERPGLSIARNTGLRAASTPIVAFTDDDIVVDRHWIAGVIQGFNRSPRIAMVAGMIPPAELRTEAQSSFDMKRERWTDDVAPEIYEMERRGEYGFLFPYSGAHIGAGANMSVQKDVILSLGGFDEALGAGRLTGGGEDVEMFVRVARCGWKIAYEPSAITWHFHRETDSALRKQLFEHSIGTGAFLARVALEPGRADVVRAAARYGYSLTHPSRSERAGPEVVATKRLSKAVGAAGVAAGPVLYTLERLRLRRLAGQAHG